MNNVGGSVGAPIAGSLLATYILTSGPFAGIFPTHLAFQYAYLIAATTTVIGTVTVLFAQEVLGSRRHAKFAHLPTVIRRRSTASGPPTPPQPNPEPEPWGAKVVAPPVPGVRVG
jgi:hypothetical protein